MTLSQENVLKDYSVHRTGVGILKTIIHLKGDIIVYEQGLLWLTKTIKNSFVTSNKIMLTDQKKKKIFKNNLFYFN